MSQSTFRVRLGKLHVTFNLSLITVKLSRTVTLTFRNGKVLQQNKQMKLTGGNALLHEPVQQQANSFAVKYSRNLLRLKVVTMI